MTEGKSINISIYDSKKNKIIRYSLEDYIVQILAFDMQEHFHIEVLKAHGIMIRTYIMRKMRLFDGKGCKNHPPADLCDDAEHCIGSIPIEEIAEERKGQLRQAVATTQNKVITYQGKLILPYYHHTCGGATANSERVVGNTIQYARQVLCEHCKSTSPHWQSSAEFSIEELEKKLNVHFPKNSPMEGPALENILHSLQREEGGRHIELKVGDKLMKGGEFQKKLGLLSTRFGWQPTSIKFFVQGEGHGIGLCKYGAQGLAIEGKTAEEILKYYFTGIEIENIPQWSIKFPLQGKIILIDVGHGGKELGIQKHKKIEKEMNLKISLLVEEKLRQAGAKIELTRRGDEYLSLGERLEHNQILRPHFLLSIHGNENPTLCNVTQIYVYPGDTEAYALGKCIVQELKKEGMDAREVAEADLYLVRESKKSALILDVGYFFLEEEDADEKISSAIYKGLLSYWGIGRME